MAEENDLYPEDEAKDAIRHFAKSVTTPLLHSPDGGFPMPIGTATFFKVGEQLFLVTAAHNFENLDLSGFCVPENREKGVWIGLSGELCRPTTRDRDLIDVAVLSLAPACAAAVIAAGWNSLGIENIEPATDQGVFVLCGYPTQRVQQKADTLLCTMITAFTQRMPRPPSHVRFTSDPDDVVDLFFHYDRMAIDTSGVEVTPPRLHGASGSNVWQYVEPPVGEFWSPSKAIKAVAIQSSEVEHECFRAKTWGAVISAIGTTHPHLTQHIATKLADTRLKGVWTPNGSNDA